MGRLNTSHFAFTFAVLCFASFAQATADFEIERVFGPHQPNKDNCIVSYSSHHSNERLTSGPIECTNRLKTSCMPGIPPSRLQNIYTLSMKYRKGDKTLTQSIEASGLPLDGEALQDAIENKIEALRSKYNAFSCAKFDVPAKASSGTQNATAATARTVQR